jgi:hypothetical protein
MIEWAFSYESTKNVRKTPDFQEDPVLFVCVEITDSRSGCFGTPPA